MSCVIYLQQWLERAQSEMLLHPAGVSFPLEGAEHARLLTPAIRDAIATGTHCSETLRRLPVVVRPGERVLVLGGGLGVLSSLVAMSDGVEQVITIEPNIELADYIGQVHKLNGVGWVEVVNAMPVRGKTRRVPLFIRDDIRASSLNPEDGPWKKIMLIPSIDLELVLVEERISLIVADGVCNLWPLLADTEFGSVETIVVGSVGGRSLEQKAALAAHLTAHGFAMRWDGATITFSRRADRGGPELDAAVSRCDAEGLRCISSAAARSDSALALRAASPRVGGVKRGWGSGVGE